MKREEKRRKEIYIMVMTDLELEEKKREGGKIERKIKLYPPCNHLKINYLDQESFFLNTK